jgi:hypothetical protein
MFIRSFFCVLIFSFMASLSIEAATLIYPLKEVKSGLKGECRTVFSGTKIETFQFEVVGIGRDFVGPGRDVVWCKMTHDPTGQMVVAGGMSGSPCYIEGKLMGALAYGWEFTKEPLFGVQPIESMLDLLNFQGNKRSTAESSPANRTYSQSASTPHRSSSFLKSFVGFMRPLSMLSSGSLAQMIPLPLEVSGLHPLISNHILNGMNEAGFFPQMSAGGGLSKAADAADFIPGAAATAVIARGDLNIAATGTLTWRDGDKILAFGHPLLGAGAVEIPLGKAEIIGIISSYMRSVKMSNKGGIVGSITQDRLSAISGIVGPTPRMVPMSVTIQRNGIEHSYHVEFCDNKFFTPMVFQTALLQFLASVMELSDESSLKLNCQIDLDSLPPLHFTDKFAGERFSWVIDAISRTASQFLPIYQNDFGIPKIKQITIRAEVLPVIEAAMIEEMTVTPLEVHPGETLKIHAGFQPWHGNRIFKDFELKLPEEIKEGEIEVTLADAQKADQLIGSLGGSLYTGAKPRNLEQFIETLNERHCNDCLYLILQTRSQGLHVQNQHLTALPESVRTLLAADQSADRPVGIQQNILSNKQIEFGSVVTGSRSIKVKIK